MAALTVAGKAPLINRGTKPGIRNSNNQKHTVISTIQCGLRNSGISYLCANAGYHTSFRGTHFLYESPLQPRLNGLDNICHR